MFTSESCLRKAGVGGGFAALLLYGSAEAQTRPDRPLEPFLTLNAGVQRPAETTFRMVAAQSDMVDRNEFITEHRLGTGVVYDFGGGVVIARRYVVGMSVSRYADERPAAMTLTLTHPLVHPTLTASAETDELERTETAAHFLFGYRVPVTDKLSVTFGGGPSRFAVRQDLVDAPRFAETFDAASRAWRITGLRADTAVGKGTAWGYNAVVDVSYMFLPNFGIGGLVRYSRATVDLPNFVESTVRERNATGETVAGGLQTAVGVRIRF